MTEASTGLVNLFDTIAGSELTWGTHAIPSIVNVTYVGSAII